jgi:hypothetical protein
MKCTLTAALVAALVVSSGHAQAQAPPVRTAAAGVLIDVSVVDQKGQPVLDLTPADFELREDGKRQQVLSVTLVRSGVRAPVGGPATGGPAPRPAAGAPAGTAPPAAERTPTATAMLFDKLSPDSMPYAARAALAHIGSLEPQHD